MQWYQQTHWRILIALGFGLIYGVLATLAGLGEFTADWIAPFGTIFLRLLLLIAVPLVLASLITGVASLADLQKLSRIGGKTIAVYIGTTFVALVIGLAAVNILKPGTTIPDGLRARLQETYQTDVADREVAAQEARERGPLDPIVDMVPENILGAASNNRAMLSVVFVAFLFGVALMLSPREAGEAAARSLREPQRGRHQDRRDGDRLRTDWRVLTHRRHDHRRSRATVRATSSSY